MALITFISDSFSLSLFSLKRDYSKIHLIVYLASFYKSYILEIRFVYNDRSCMWGNQLHVPAPLKIHNFHPVILAKANLTIYYSPVPDNGPIHSM